MGYKARRSWRHFKYWLLERFFGKPDLKKLIDLEHLDFKDATKITRLQVSRDMTKEQHDYYFKDNTQFNVEYGLRYDMARELIGSVAKHLKLAVIYDTDIEKYICYGELHTIEKK